MVKLFILFVEATWLYLLPIIRFGQEIILRCLSKKLSSLGYYNHKPPSDTQVHQFLRYNIQNLVWNLQNESKGFHPRKKSCQAIHTQWSRNHQSKDITEFFIEVSQCLLSRGARYTENVLVNSFTSC